MYYETEQSNSPAVIEDEPSHEIYASLIGKNALTIISKPTSKPPSSSQIEYSSSIPHQVSVIPNNYNRDEKLGIEESNPPSQNSAAKSTRKHASPADVYKRAFSPTYKDAAPTLSQLSLDQKNKGFQMLSKMGFHEKDGGLGKHRQGQMTPVKTVLKLDQRGLGSGRRLIPKVTHKFMKKATCGGDTERKLTKAERKRLGKLEREKDQLKMKKARMMISTDLDEKYGVFLGL